MIDKSRGGECAGFKFGDERALRKQKIIHVPVRIGSKIIKLKTYLLPGSVPYVLGMEALRAMKANIDLSDSTIELLGTKIRGRSNKSGHITVNFDTQLVEDKCNVVLLRCDY